MFIMNPRERSRWWPFIEVSVPRESPFLRYQILKSTCWINEQAYTAIRNCVHTEKRVAWTSGWFNWDNNFSFENKESCRTLVRIFYLEVIYACWITWKGTAGSSFLMALELDTPSPGTGRLASLWCLSLARCWWLTMPSLGLSSEYLLFPILSLFVFRFPPTQETRQILLVPILKAAFQLDYPLQGLTSKTSHILSHWRVRL